MSFQPGHPDAPCLRYPENLGLHANVTIENATSMLLRATQLSQTTPYQWGYIDKPNEGQLILLFLPNPTQFPNDGIRYQDQETRYALSAPGNREIEVAEVKYGFVPNSSDTTAWRVRRRYRLQKGGHPQLSLVHYTRGPAIQIVPSLLNSPVRQYPLRQLNDPPIFVMGEKAGQKAYPPGAGPPPPQPPAPPPQTHMGMNPQGMGMNPPPPGMNPQAMAMNPQAMGIHPMNPQAMLAQQNSNMEALERRRERERARERAGSMPGRPGPPRLDDDDSADESDMISTRTLALTRYRRNHELMEQVFKQAAFGNKNPQKPKSVYSIFDKSELEAKVVKLEAEVEALQAKAAEYRARRSAVDDIVATGHTPMEVS
ncbi:hypothetical protein F5I97DRAFT_1937372 [Phlebopus sp. FC_14]|nr:hypothetical protein F5I97DRAFT_1937372 [Phlebopus sp. FC_14]